MVMHARKVARLDDGYRDLNQSEILSKDKSLSHSHLKYGDRKASKFEGFDHRRRSNSPRLFHCRPSHYDEKPRERRNYEENDVGSRDSKSKDQKHKHHKYEVHRLAERVCGDWSEHISRSGKRYFYNCRTEVSQWEKPDCWIEENSTSVKNSEKIQQDASDRSKSSSSSKANSHIGEPRHSAANNKMLSSKSSSRRDGRDCRVSGRDEKLPSKNISGGRDVNSTTQRERMSRQDRKRPHSRRSSSRSPAHSQKSGKFESRGSSSEAGSGGCYRNNSGKNEFSGSGGSTGNGGVSKKYDAGTINSGDLEGGRFVDLKENIDYQKNSPVHEDMDISPDNSFSQNDVDTRTSRDELNSKSPVLPPSSNSHSNQTSTGITNDNNGETLHSQDHTQFVAPSGLIHPPSSQDSSSMSASSCSTSAQAVTTLQSSTSWSSTNIINPLQQQQQQSLQTTLAGLQQAVLRLNPDKVSASVSGQQSQANFASCVALLPVLLAQLSNQQQGGSGNSNSDNQLIIQQAIPLLKKLQEIVVHQQQQQQQRKLQEVLFRLLQMQNAGNSSVHGTSHKLHGNDKAESPYSPPDSDGSPVDTPNHSRQSLSGNRPSPRRHQLHQDANQQAPPSRHVKQEKTPFHQTSTDDSEERPTAGSVSNAAAAHPRLEKNDARPSVTSQISSSSAGSQTPSQHPSVPFYQRTEIELSPSLIGYFNPKLIEHTTNWQADSLVKQAECIAADNYSYLGLLSSQVSVELKQARSMIRAQEILSTRHEQRRIFIQHQLYELDRGLAMPSILTPNHASPLLVAFGQQPAAHPAPSQHVVHHLPSVQTTHHPSIQSTASVPINPPSSQSTAPSSQTPLHPSSPANQQETPATPISTSIVAASEESAAELT